MIQSSLLRPDMGPIRTTQRETSEESSRTSEIVQQLSQIVRSNEEASRDVDSSSQYSSELLNPEASHTKSLSFETDNTDLSLPRFSAVAPSVPKLNGVKKEVVDEEAAYRKELRKFAGDESAKIYIIDASTPSPKSQRYLESGLEYEVPRTVEGLEAKMDEVRMRRRPVTTINLQVATQPVPAYYCPAALKRMAIQGIF